MGNEFKAMKDIELHEFDLQFFPHGNGTICNKKSMLETITNRRHWHYFDDTNGDPPHGARPWTTFPKVVLRGEWIPTQGQGLLGRSKEEWPLGSQAAGPASLREELGYYELARGKHLRAWGRQGSRKMKNLSSLLSLRSCLSPAEGESVMKKKCRLCEPD